MLRAMRALSAIAAGALISVSSILAIPATAQTFPSKPITFIVPWPAGGATDIVGRAMAESASKHLGQPIVVDNKSGASGTLGPAQVAATAKPDGYTIVQMPITVYRLPLMKGKTVTWDPAKDFSYIIHMTGYTFMIGAKAGGPFKTWDDVVKYAKANPGKLTYGTPGAGTSLHIGMELISAKAGIKATHVPFKGGAETTAALIGGHVDLSVEGTSMMPLIEAKQIVPLMVWTGARVKRLPDTPSLKEMGFNFVFDSPWGIAGPKGMDPAVMAKLHDAFKKSLDDPAVQAVMDRYMMPPNYADPKGYLKIIAEVTAYEKEALTRIGLAK